MNQSIESKFCQVGDVSIHYLTAGQGDTILLIHGWPTSAYLWRNIIPELSQDYKVIAIDLPGYGKSEKRLSDSYSFRYYSRILAGFLQELKIDTVALGVHDVGGPIGLYFMTQNMGRVKKLILFNTLVYPKFSWAVKVFAMATILPGVRHWLTSPRGIKWAIRFGVSKKNKLSVETIQAYQKPYIDWEPRKLLTKSIQRLSINAYKEMAEALPSFTGPVLLLYGEQDRILPKVAETMAKVKTDLPQAVVKTFPDCGHFLQEDEPAKIGKTVLEFMLESDNDRNTH